MPAKCLDYLRRHHIALIALFVALGGTSYAAATGSIDSREIKNNTVRGKDVRNNSLTGRDVRGIRSGDVADASLLSRDFAPGQLPQGARGATGPTGSRGAVGAKGDQGDPGVVGGLTVQRLDVALNDGTAVANSVPCPAGHKIIGGSANVSDGAGDAYITVSRPSQSANQLVPNSGEGFDRWRGGAVNPAGGSGNMTLRIWAICTPGEQQSVPSGPGGVDD